MSPDTTEHREPSSRVLIDWTPTQIRTAEALADAGSLRLAAELCEALLADDRVTGVLSTRTRGLLGLPLTFEESGDGRRKKKALRALEAEEDWWAAFPEDQLGQLLDWGVLLGVGLGELVWIERGARVLPTLKVWHPRHLRYDWSARVWMLTTEAGEVRVTPGDGKWILYTPQGINRPWSRGAWRALSRWWLLKHFARQDFARHSEVHGTPLRLGIGAEGSQKGDRDKLAKDLAELGRDTALCVPFGWDVKLVEATARTHEMFVAQTTLADTATAIVLVGQNLTTEVKGGSFAAATVHRVVRADIIRSDGETASTTLHDQALTFWAEFNFGARSLAPWPQWATQPPEDAKATAETRKAQADAIGAARLAGVDPEPLAEEFGMTLTAMPSPAAPPAPARGTRAARAVDPMAPLLAGQTYADDVVDAARGQAVEAADALLGAVLAIIGQSRSFEDLRARLLVAFPAMDETAFRRLVQGATTIAGAAGAWSAQREAG
jgi:phage gp29-like protein